MALRIITADERLSEDAGKTTMAIFGPSGAGKTSLLKTLPPVSHAVAGPFGPDEASGGFVMKVVAP